jgi:hypothetical protein
MRNDYILLDDDLEIMVIPHKPVSLPSDRKWLTYDEVDKMRKIFPRFPRMMQTYNNMAAWVERMELVQRKELGE